MNHAISTRGVSKSKSRSLTLSSYNLRSSFEYLIHYQSKILVLIEWSYWTPFVMFSIQHTMVIVVWACNPKSFTHMSFWYLLLEPRQSTYRSNIVGTEEWLSTLANSLFFQWVHCSCQNVTCQCIINLLWRWSELERRNCCKNLPKAHLMMIKIYVSSFICNRALLCIILIYYHLVIHGKSNLRTL